MMNKIQVTFYDGIISKPYQAELQSVDELSVLILYGDGTQQRIYAYTDMTLIGALGQIHPVIELKDDARLEFNDALPDWFNLKTRHAKHVIWKLERTPSLIIFSLFFVATLVFTTIKWGIPVASHYVAYHLPEDILKQIGDEAEKYVIDMTASSEIPQLKQQQLIDQYQKLIAEGRPAKIIFRKGDRLGANAVAIPNNTIIVTDELVKLAQDDREIIGVLAHEQGHLVLRHSLQQTLSSLGFGVILIAITGDSSSLVSTVPVAIIGANYSRNFESEADGYALQTMYKNKIPTIYFANFLERLDNDESSETKSDQDSEKNVDEKSVMDFLESHPATQERVQAVKDFESKHK